MNFRDRMSFYLAAGSVTYAVLRYKRYLERRKAEYASIADVFETLTTVVADRAPDVLLDERIRKAVNSAEFVRIVSRY